MNRIEYLMAVGRVKSYSSMTAFKNRPRVNWELIDIEIDLLRLQARKKFVKERIQVLRGRQFN